MARPLLNDERQGAADRGQRVVIAPREAIRARPPPVIAWPHGMVLVSPGAVALIDWVGALGKVDADLAAQAR